MVKLKWQSCCWKREYRPFLQTERVCSPYIWLHRDPWRRGTAEAMKVQYLYVVSQYISESLEDRSRELRQTLLMRDQQDTGTSCSPLHPLGGPAAVAICPCEVGCHDSRQADSSALCCSLWCVWSHGGWAFAACIHEERQGQRWTICITSAEGGCQEPSGVKMGVYWEYTQWFTLGSLVVFGVLFLLTLDMQNAKLQEMQSQNVSWFWAKVRDSWGRTPLHWAVVNGHRQGMFGNTFLPAHFFPQFLQCAAGRWSWSFCMKAFSGKVVRASHAEWAVSNLQVKGWG